MPALTECQLAVLEVVVDFGLLLTTRVHACVTLLDMLMVRVLVVAPGTPTGGGSKLAPFCYHWYVSVLT